jgi:hypothetical protein
MSQIPNTAQKSISQTVPCRQLTRQQSADRIRGNSNVRTHSINRTFVINTATVAPRQTVPCRQLTQQL